MPAAHLLTDTEKSSVPYKTPLKNHRERTILGVFVKLGVRTLIPISHILAISPTLEHRQVAPAQARQQLKPHATARHVRHDPQVWTPQNLRHGNLKPGLRLRPCAAPPEPTQPLRNGKSPVVCGADTGASSLVRRNGKLQRHPLGLLTQTTHSVRVLLHKPRPGAPSGIGELFDAVDH